MKIRYFGHSCFEIVTQKGVRILTDPYQGVGYALPCGLQADIVTVSHGHFDHSYTQGVAANRIVTALGKQASLGVDVEGIDSAHDEKGGALRGRNTIYKIQADGLTLCHMGDIGESCSVELLAKIGKVDILFLPVGGNYTVDAQGARAYIEGIRPKAVIPMHYKPADGSLDIAGIQPFLRLFPQAIHLPKGELDADENTNGIYYMERVN